MALEKNKVGAVGLGTIVQGDAGEGFFEQRPEQVREPSVVI